MAKFEVIEKFEDKYTGEIYLPGVFFESEDEERISKIQEMGLIGEEVSLAPSPDPDGNGVAPDWPKHAGGGYYLLPNGEKVQGKEAAEEALKKLQDQG